MERIASPMQSPEHYALADPVELGRVIRRLRKHRGLTQRELAQKISEGSDRSVDPTFVSLVESGNRIMSFPTFMALARAFDVPGEWLVILAFRNRGGRDRGIPAIDELGEKLKQTIESALFETDAE
jgi:transcriptional regulator with XRE-family HTH domain